MALSPAFSPDAARSLAGPDWLRLRRAEAAERLAAMSWPSSDEESWRYTRVQDLTVADRAPSGFLTKISGAEGLHIEVSPESFGGSMTVALDIFAEMNNAFADAPIVLRVPRGRTVEAPVVITHVLPAGASSFPRVIVEVGENADVTVVEKFVGGANGLICPVVELRAAQSARLRYQALNEVDETAWLIANQVGRSERDSTTVIANVAFGGAYARIRTDARLLGQGAHGEQIGVSFGGGDQMLDVRVAQIHGAPRTTSDLLFKGVVQDQARSVYTGLIHIEPSARGARAFQTNRNLKLSPDAWADSVPNLNIENNDVKCSHASTVGPIDDDQRFYLESRGVPTEIAERLIVLGFFDDVIDKLPSSVFAAELREQVAAKLDHRRVVVTA